MTEIKRRDALVPDPLLKGRSLLPDLLGYNLRRAQVALFRDFAAATEEYDITPGQFGVLILVDATPGLNQTELGEAMGVDRSTVVAVIDRLQKRGLVERRAVPADRRSHALHLTAPGRQLLARMIPAVRAHEARFAGHLADAERRELTALLKKLAG